MPTEDPTEMPEGRRNAVLRAVDWRFLLSRPEAPVLAASAPGPRRGRPGLFGDDRSAPARPSSAVIGFPTRRAIRTATDGRRRRRRPGLPLAPASARRHAPGLPSA